MTSTATRPATGDPPRGPPLRRTLTTPTLLRIPGTQPDLLSRLPLELGLHIMDLLATSPPRRPSSSAALGNSSPAAACSSTRTLCACALVCRYWARLALDDTVWQHHYARVVARRLFHVDPRVLHPMCDFAGLPRRRAGVVSSASDAGSGDWDNGDDDDDASCLTDRELVGLLTARAHLGVLDGPSLHSLRWCMSLPPAALRDPALAHRRSLVLDHLMRATHPHWLAPYPPLNFRWLSKWKYACAVARADTRRVVLTGAELVRMCFYMHFNDWDSATLTRGGGVFPARLPPTNVSVFCADGQYRTTYYPPDSPIRMHWHWVTEKMDGSVVAAPPFVREVGGDEEVSEDDDDDESSSEEDDDDDESETDEDTDGGSTASAWTLRPLMPVGPMTPMAGPMPGAGLVMPAAMAHAQYPVAAAPTPGSYAATHGRVDATSWRWYPRASLARIAPVHARFLDESMFIGRAELPLASTQHHRYRESLLQVDSYLPITVSRNPSTGQWILLNRYYMFESLQQPVGPGIAWVAIADQHQYQHHQHQHWPAGGYHQHSGQHHGHHGPPPYPAHPQYP